MASDYLPGVYTRIGTEENPGTFRGGSGSGISNSMPPITVKPWVLKNDNASSPTFQKLSVPHLSIRRF